MCSPCIGRRTFGGGTSVVGGVAPLRGESHSAVVALDLGALRGLLDVDRESLTVRVAAGMRAPALERELRRPWSDTRPLSPVF